MTQAATLAQLASSGALTADTSGDVGIGGPSNGIKLYVKRSAGSNASGEIYLTDGTQWTLQNSNTSAGSYNPAVQNNDTSIIYSNGTQDNGAFLIGQWSATAGRGIRIDGTGNFQFNSGYGSISTAYGCRAWVNFNGTGTVAIRASGNVTSITDNSTGDYTINFSNAMPNANYCAIGLNYLNAGVARYPVEYGVQSTSSVRVYTTGSYGGALTDSAFVEVAIIR